MHGNITLVKVPHGKNLSVLESGGEINFYHNTIHIYQRRTIS